jgi:circadian clock protein KaiB
LEFILAKNDLVWEFDIYIAGLTPKSELTYNNLLEICQQYLGNTCIINVIDLLKNPKIAAEKQIMAIPTTIRKKPAPERILIGDLSNTERVISILNLKDFQ